MEGSKLRGAWHLLRPALAQRHLEICIGYSDKKVKMILTLLLIPIVSTINGIITKTEYQYKEHT